MRRIWIVAIAFTAGCAGGQHPWSDHRLCEAERQLPGEPADAAAWIPILLRGFDATTRRATVPAVDCTGTQVRWDTPALLCTDASTATALLPDRPLGAEDVVVTSIDERHRLVWVVTNRYASGDGLGPVAVVEVNGPRLTVQAVGTLRANFLRPKLRLERLGEGEALVAEGEQCASADPASCNRAARVMPFVKTRFSPTWVTNEAGGCVSPAWFHLGREESERLASGWHRRYRLEAALVFDPAGFTVQEQVLVHDLDPRNPTTPPRLFRRAESDLRVRLDNGRLVSDGASLWTRMMAARP